ALRSFATEVMPKPPFWSGQSAGSVTSTGSTSHQIAFSVFASALAITWLWFGVGRNTFVAGAGSFPSATSTLPRSTAEACIVQVPGIEPGPGQSVNTSGLIL